MKSKNWVLLRGLIRDQRHWGAFLPMFRKAFVNDRVITIDFPGVGSRYNETSPWSIGELAEDVRRQAHSQCDPPYSLLTISLGGMVALEWMARSPSDISKFIVINVSDNSSPFYHRFRPSALRVAARAALSRDPKVKESRILSFISNSVENANAVTEEWAGYASETPLQLRTAAAQLWAASRFQAPLQIEPPGFFFVGLGDRMVDPSCSFRVSERLKRPILTHPWGGHDLTLDDPNWVTQSALKLAIK